MLYFILGLPATTINWGQWGEVGVAKDIRIKVLSPFSTLQGTLSLKKCLELNKIQSMVCSLGEVGFKYALAATKMYTCIFLTCFK